MCHSFPSAWIQQKKCIKPGWYVPSLSMYRWWRHQMKAFPRNWPFVIGGFPSQRPVTRSFSIVFDLRLNKRLSKLSGCRRFETPSRSVWHHCIVVKLWISTWGATSISSAFYTFKEYMISRLAKWNRCVYETSGICGSFWQIQTEN